MIGFEETLKGDVPLPGEGPETEGLSKIQLYNRVNRQYFLPPLCSRGVTRKWLLDVEHSRVYRLTHHEIRHFEVDLKSEMQRKVGTQSAALVVKKVNALLIAQGMPKLGFTDHEVPDLTWLMRMARAIDMTNVLELFEKAVQEEPGPCSTSPLYSKVYWGRRFAAESVFRTPKVKKHRGFWDEIKTISDAYKLSMSIKISVEVLKEELRIMTEKMILQEGNVSDLVSKAAQTLTALEDDTVRPSMIINPNSLSEVHRKALDINNKL